MIKILSILLFAVSIGRAADYVPNELIIATDGTVDIVDIIADVKVFLDNSYTVNEFAENLYLIHTKNGKMDKVTNLLKPKDGVKYIQPNFIKKALK